MSKFWHTFIIALLSGLTLQLLQYITNIDIDRLPNLLMRMVIGALGFSVLFIAYSSIVKFFMQKQSDS